MKKIALLGLACLVLSGCGSVQKPIKKEPTITMTEADINQLAQNNISKNMNELENKEGFKCDIYDSNGIHNWYFLEEFQFVLQNKLSPLKKSPILDSGKIYCVIDKYGNNIPRTYNVNVVERGLINNVEYSINYSDFSGNIGNDSKSSDNYWMFGCRTDKMNDKKECSADNYYANVSILKNKHGYLLQIGYDHYPGKKVSIRINKDKVLNSWRENGTFNYQISNNIIKSIKNNDVVYVRYVKWPYENEITNQLDVSYFKEVLRLLDTIYNLH